MRAGQKLTIAAVSLALLMVVGWIGTRLGHRTVPRAPSVAHVEVISIEAHILAAPDAGAKPVMPRLQKGDHLNVLQLPRSLADQWVKVQYVGPRAQSPLGYVQAEALGHWSSEKPDAALALLKLFGPGEAATEADIRQQLQKLTAFLDRFGGTEQAPEANLELAQLNLKMAKLGQSQGRPSTDRRPYLVAAAEQLAVAGRNQGLSNLVEQAGRELKMLQTSEKPAPIRPRGAQALPPEQAIRMAEAAGQEARYDAALRLLESALRDNPNHQGARSLYDRVLRAKKKDPGAQ